MSHKTLVRIAIIMIIVFGVITILYPRLFNPENSNLMAPVETTP